MIWQALTLQLGYNATLVAIGATLLGVSAGVTGTFLFLRKRALVSDAVSHATLPGVCLAFILMALLGGDGRNLIGLLAGSAVSAWVGLWCLNWLTRNTRLAEDAAIGAVLSVFFGFGIVLLTVIQTLGIGPHRLNRPSRPDWFFDRAAYGGILTDIASHQIDQFLFFTGSTDATVTLARVANYANPDDPGLQDFGEIALQSPQGHGYIRVDWYTPDALPTWGDGRLTILGTEGYIELRKYVDVGQPGTDHLILVNGTRSEKIDASGAGLPFFARLIADIRDRSETAMTQAHVFKVCALSLQAQAMAEAANA